MGDFQRFYDHCAYARAMYLHVQMITLGTTPEDRQRADQEAPLFFADMIGGLKRLTILEVCKLLDHDKGANGADNLSLKYLLKQAGPMSPQDFPGLDQAVERLDSFNKLLQPARHKIIAHNDRAAITAGSALGGATQSDWDQCWKDIDAAVNCLSLRLTGHEDTITGIGGLSDAEYLFKALARADAFDRLVQAGNSAAVEELANLH